uniref:SPARC-like protein 1 n=1 Tax=Gouania willdenowi TaxID=441366 RepID=A0A8C5D7W7_GOUWI
MRVCLVYLCVLAATFVNSKAHIKHHGLHKATAEEKDLTKEEVNKPDISPTLMTFEDNSQEPEDEELSSEGNIDANQEGGDLAQTEKNTAVLLSERELVDLLKSDAKDDQEEEVEEEEEEEEEEEKEKVNQSKVESIKDVEIPQDKIDNEGKERNEREEMPTDENEQMGMIVESDDSIESEIPVNLDDTTDKIPKAGMAVSAKVQTQSDGESVDSIVISEEKPASISHGYEQNMQNMEAADSEKELDLDNDKTLKVKLRKTSEDKTDDEANLDHLETKSSIDHDTQSSEKEEEMSKNESGSHIKRKTRKQKKNHRTRKHSPQKDEAHPEPSQKNQKPKESEGNTDSLPQKAKRRRAGKWGPLVGVNPVQIRATVDLYPRSRPSYDTGKICNVLLTLDPCDNFRCKRGKTCKLNEKDKPSCVCQQATECPPSVNDFDHVCGTDNRTYDTSCELFATKCNLEGTKKGHRLHLDYTGSCKLIPQCVDTELVQFPLRMRDWLKNVLLQLYEHDSVTPGFLTPKQRFRVKKIFDSERRLQAGDHSVELLAQDFEKNYNMYIYPVHWQFAQLDQHPSDRYLAHSELAPLRVPLVPMEHCTSRFFQECDADKDKQVSFKEWTTCFGIKNGEKKKMHCRIPYSWACVNIPLTDLTEKCFFFRVPTEDMDENLLF